MNKDTLPPLRADIFRGDGAIWKNIIRWKNNHAARSVFNEAMALEAAITAEMQAYARQAVESDRAQRVPDGWRLERQRHIANEWADLATTGLQWLRNIKDGTSTVDEALANMDLCLVHVRKVNDAPGLYGAASPPPGEPEHKPLFGEMIAQHEGLAEELAALATAPPGEPAPEPQGVPEPAWNDSKQAELNDWFLSLSEGKQKALLDGGRWELAGAAFLAGKSANPQPPAEPAPSVQPEQASRVGEEGWRNLAEIQAAQLKTIERIDEIEREYGLSAQPAPTGAQPAPTQAAVDERAAFEAWAKDAGWPHAWRYCNTDGRGFSNDSWLAWKARAAISPSQPKQASRIAFERAIEALDELEAAARGDEPFPHFAGLLIRQTLAAHVQEPCDVPPPGWYCTRWKGHDGPCAAHPAPQQASAQPQQERKPMTADDLREPKNGKEWRVEWWNESCRMMLPADMRLDAFQSYKNGTLQFTLKHHHGITSAPKEVDR